jgi:hypothetical protein
MKPDKQIRPSRASSGHINCRSGIFGLTLLLLLIPKQSCPQNEELEERMFSLTVQEHRREERTSLRGSDPMWIDFESELTLFGHINTEVSGDSVVFTTFNDSMQFKSTLPYEFNTFMSRDTLYYSSDARRNVVSGGFIEMYDTMLACLFEGPALIIRFSDSNEPSSITHLKGECESGEYSRLDLQFALGIFFASEWKPSLQEDSRWVEDKSIPPYSRLGYRPSVRTKARIVQIKDDIITAVLSSDTTLTNIHTILPNGESATIIQDALHLGGTLFLAQGNGLPLKGEIRIEESMQIFRPKISERAVEKECAYILRFRIF